MHKVKKAIFLAAGKGERMAPLTDSRPKPLVHVDGRRIIDTALDACLAAGIGDIWIVRGYLGHMFDELLSRYPVQFIENPSYDYANNIISVAAAAEKVGLEDSYIIEADIVVRNWRVITSRHQSSNFLGIPVKHTGDWCFHVQDGVISQQSLGGDDCYQQVGISFWAKRDAEQLQRDIFKVFDMPGSQKLFFDQVPFCYAKENYGIAVRECNEFDVVELDTVEEVKQYELRFGKEECN